MGGKGDRREQLRKVAENTLQIFEAGAYINRDNAKIDLAEDLKSCRLNTVYFPPDEEIILSGNTSIPTSTSSNLNLSNTSPNVAGSKPLQVEVVDMGSLSAAYKLVKAAIGKVGVLNFASAKNPGGGFRKGSHAQEESIARKTGLYLSIKGSPYYRNNRQNNNQGLYTDGIIYSPGVPVIKDEDHLVLNKPWKVDIISAPAPNSGVAKRNGVTQEMINQTLYRRADRVLAVAVKSGITVLVLGAWGCGVFRNDPVKVAQVWADLLRTKYAGKFLNVTFATIGPSINRIPFQTIFETS